MNMEQQRKAATESTLIFLSHCHFKEGKGILLRVQRMKDGGELCYWMSRKLSRFEDLMRDYTQRIGVKLNSVEFIYKGSPINPIVTPDFLKMEDDDIIHAIESVEDVVSETESTLIYLSQVKEENHILIKVQGVQGDKLFYWVGRNTPLRNLMVDYCDRTGAFYECMRFVRFRDECVINPDKTADDLKMVNEDLIHASLK